MTFAIHGLAVSRGIAIGRAVVVAASRVEVRHYFIDANQVEAELDRARKARAAVVDELQRLVSDLPEDAPGELAALLEVHLMLLQDEVLAAGVRHWVAERLYNAEWALMTQLEQISRQFDEMEDPYLRERKTDLEQVADRVLRQMRGLATSTRGASASPSSMGCEPSCAGAGGGGGAATGLVARPRICRHAAVQAQRVCRFCDGRRWQDQPHRDRRA